MRIKTATLSGHELKGLICEQFHQPRSEELTGPELTGLRRVEKQTCRLGGHESALKGGMLIRPHLSDCSTSVKALQVRPIKMHRKMESLVTQVRKTIIV